MKNPVKITETKVKGITRIEVESKYYTEPKKENQTLNTLFNKIGQFYQEQYVNN